jgi:hydrogenase maturation protease
MPRVLILGYGNPLRGDDAFGWRVAERLMEMVHDPHVEILCLQQLTPELMERLSEAEFSIFIDAAASGEPGEMIERRIGPAAASGAAFTHHATPEALLAGARALYGRAPEAVMISVGGADFGLGAELSPSVVAHLEEVTSAVLRLVAARV